MAESVDALVSNTSGATRAGSTPALGTRNPCRSSLQGFLLSHHSILVTFWPLFSIGRCKNTWQLHLEKLWLSIPTKRINRPERLFTDFFIVLRDAFSQFKKFLLALFCSFLLITVIGKVTSLIEKTVVHLLELIDIPLSNLV